MPENISLRFQRPTLYDFILKSTHSLTFPLLSLNIKRDPKMQDYSIDIRVGSKLHEHIKKIYGDDELLTYISLANSQVGFWGYDLVFAIRLLSNMGIVGSRIDWLKKARDSIAKILTNESVNSINRNTKALKTTEELLTSMGIGNDVKNNDKLMIIVKDVINSRKMDADTIIYRLALSIYHAKSATGEDIIPGLENPADIYLKLSQSTFYNDHIQEFKGVTKLPIDLRTLVIKIFAALAVSAYVYYKAVELHK